MFVQPIRKAVLFSIAENFGPVVTVHGHRRIRLIGRKRRGFRGRAANKVHLPLLCIFPCRSRPTLASYARTEDLLNLIYVLYFTKAYNDRTERNVSSNNSSPHSFSALLYEARAVSLPGVASEARRSVGRYKVYKSRRRADIFFGRRCAGGGREPAACCEIKPIISGYIVSNKLAPNTGVQLFTRCRCRGRAAVRGGPRRADSVCCDIFY
ncbi:hypothetical protein EVAR_16894_1 [Eumeta japonica]|uniref:Uncharacterized protein n=1 Tax=Eumeta variegata TaxID=151549 RepID=A0A4C1TV93_EUMVA|nr:hypothetical protein EVAR_16894_1 [Eumeta japonica]